MEEVLHALSGNDTIMEAQFDLALFPDGAVSALGAVLRFNKQLTFDQQNLDESGLRDLAHTMINKYTLKKLSFDHWSRYSDSYALILDILNRNLSLLNRAILFLRSHVLERLDAFHEPCDSYAFAGKYATTENIPMPAARDTIAAALDWYGCGAEW